MRLKHLGRRAVTTVAATSILLGFAATPASATPTETQISVLGTTSGGGNPSSNTARPITAHQILAQTFLNPTATDFQTASFHISLMTAVTPGTTGLDTPVKLDVYALSGPTTTTRILQETHFIPSHSLKTGWNTFALPQEVFTPAGPVMIALTLGDLGYAHPSNPLPQRPQIWVSTHTAYLDGRFVQGITVPMPATSRCCGAPFVWHDPAVSSTAPNVDAYFRATGTTGGSSSDEDGDITDPALASEVESALHDYFSRTAAKDWNYLVTALAGSSTLTATERSCWSSVVKNAGPGVVAQASLQQDIDEMRGSTQVASAMANAAVETIISWKLSDLLRLNGFDHTRPSSWNNVDLGDTLLGYYISDVVSGELDVFEDLGLPIATRGHLNSISSLLRLEQVSGSWDCPASA